MLVMSEVSDYLTSTSEAGIKITLHPQDCYPYPNVEGYKFGVGVMGGIYVSYVRVSLRINLLWLDRKFLKKRLF